MKQIVLLVSLFVGLATLSFAQDFLPVPAVEHQPFISGTQRLLDALHYVGAPVKPEDQTRIRSLMRDSDSEKAVTGIQVILDGYCVAGVHINPESRVKVDIGPVEKKLVQQGWRTFLVKVHNEAGITPQLIAESPNAAPQFRRSNSSSSPELSITLALAVMVHESSTVLVCLNSLRLLMLKAEE